MIIQISALRGVPKIAVDGCAARGGAPFELERTRLVSAAHAARVDGILQAEQQAVQIDRHDFRGIHRRPGMSVGEPARSEVPAAFRRGSNVAKQLRCGAPAGARELRICAV